MDEIQRRHGIEIPTRSAGRVHVGLTRLDEVELVVRSTTLQAHAQFQDQRSPSGGSMRIDVQTSVSAELPNSFVVRYHFDADEAERVAVALRQLAVEARRSLERGTV